MKTKKIIPILFILIFAISVSGNSSLVNIGKKSYALEHDKIYLFTTYKSALTNAVSPRTNEWLDSVPVSFREYVLNAGHMGFLHIDDSGTIIVSASEWRGVRQERLADSMISKSSISGLYEISGLEKNEMEKAIKSTISPGTGWFFFNVESGLGVKIVNIILGNNHSTYIGCVGFVTKVFSKVDPDFLENIEYLPIKGCKNMTSMQSYVKGYGISPDKATSYASYICSTIDIIENYRHIKSIIGLKPPINFVSPVEILVGKIESGTLIPIEPKIGPPTASYRKTP